MGPGCISPGPGVFSGGAPRAGCPPGWDPVLLELEPEPLALAAWLGYTPGGNGGPDQAGG